MLGSRINNFDRINNFKKHMDIAVYLTDVMLKLNDYLTQCSVNQQKTSTCENITVEFIAGHSVRLHVFSFWNGASYGSSLAGQFYCKNNNIDKLSKNHRITYNTIEISSNKKPVEVEYNSGYKLEYPYDFSEEMYFQKYTLSNLPPEEYYKEASKFLKTLEPFDIEFMFISPYTIKKEHVDAIDDVLNTLAKEGVK